MRSDALLGYRPLTALAVSTLALSVLGLALALPAAAQEGEADEEAHPNMAEAMSGGGMTEDRQLDDARAREHFQIATRYYDEGRFIEAATQFEEAFGLSDRPELLYNAYIAYRDAHRPSDAARTLELYLQRTPEAPDRVNLEARLQELRRAVAEEERNQQQLESAQAAADAERARAEAEARRAAEAEAQPEVWPWIILGVGAATAIAGGVVAGIALNDSNALRSLCTDEDPPRCTVSSQENLDEQRDAAKSLALAADILMFGGGAIAVAGLILGLTVGLPGGAEPAEEGDVQASVECGPGYCGASVRGAF